MTPLVDQVIGAEVRAVRQARHWTQQDLADRLTELGKDTKRSTIVDIEKGKRAPKASEWFLFAVALEVSPLRLLGMFGEGDDELRLTSTTSLRGRTARHWIPGQVSLRKEGKTRESQHQFFSEIDEYQWNGHTLDQAVHMHLRDLEDVVHELLPLVDRFSDSAFDGVIARLEKLENDVKATKLAREARKHPRERPKRVRRPRVA